MDGLLGKQLLQQLHDGGNRLECLGRVAASSAASGWHELSLEDRKRVSSSAAQGLGPFFEELQNIVWLCVLRCLGLARWVSVTLGTCLTLLLLLLLPWLCFLGLAAGWSPLHRLAQSAAAATNAADRGRFLRCIRDTVDRLVAVQLQEAAAAAAAQHQPLQQAVAAARECVVEYVSAAPAPSRHYTGHAVLSGMNVVQMAMERFDAAAATVLAAAAAAGGL